MRNNPHRPRVYGRSPRPLRELFRDIQPKVAHYRIFTADRRHVKALTEASEKALTGAAGESIPTNIQ